MEGLDGEPGMLDDPGHFAAIDRFTTGHCERHTPRLRVGCHGTGHDPRESFERGRDLHAALDRAVHNGGSRAVPYGLVVSGTPSQQCIFCGASSDIADVRGMVCLVCQSGPTPSGGDSDVFELAVAE